jgi:hypothetical protein
VVRHREVEPEQLQDGVDEALGLAQRQAANTARSVKAVAIAKSE